MTIYSEYMKMINDSIKDLEKINTKNKVILECKKNEYEQLIRIKNSIKKKYYYPEYHAKYYNKNKNMILERMRVKHHCEICGGKYATGSISKHVKTKKHIFSQNLRNELSNK